MRVVVAAVLLIPALAAHGQNRQMEVLSVFAPGDGTNLTAGSKHSHSFGDQVSMYRDLPTHLRGLTDADVHSYFKPATFDVPPQDVASVESPRPGVKIVRDKTYNIPHVEADTREDAMFAIGYARAEDRLWQMEEFRATWRAATAALLGAGKHNENVLNDAHVFRVVDYSEDEYQSMFDALATDYGQWGRQASRDITAYVAGLNAYIDKLASHPELMPVEYRHRHLQPGRWKVTDVMAMAAYTHVAWGGLLDIDPDANSRLLHQLQQRFGATALAIFRDLRMAPDADTPASIASTKPLHRSSIDPRSTAILDPDSFVARQVVTPGGIAIAEGEGGPIRRLRSNALLVAAKDSATGHPIAVQGPQDGYGTPHIFDSEIAVSAPDFEAHGVLEISGPYPYVASHGDNYAWSVTVLFPDQSDLYAEKLCEPDGRAAGLQSEFYEYRGRCIPFAKRSEYRRIRGATNGYALISQRSVHGPILGRAKVNGIPAALSLARTMFMHEEMDFPAHAQLFSRSRVRSAKDFLHIVAGTAYNIGWWYVDRHDIGYVDAGLVPVRNPHVSTDFPVWGTGEWDWAGFDARHYTFQVPRKSAYPQAINPPDGVLAGWNNVSAVGWPVPGYVWGWGKSRVSELKDPTVAATKRARVSIADLVKIHTRAAVTDVRAYLYYPALRKYLGKVSDPDLEAMLTAVDAWVQDGALRQDPAQRGYLDHSPAIAFMDSAWEPLIRTVFEPVFGRMIMDEAQAKNNLPPTVTTPAYQNGWLDYLWKDMDRSGDARAPLSRRYCGSNDVSCRQLIIAGLTQGMAIARHQYGSHWQDWRVPTLCGRCKEIRFPATGDAVPVPPIPWQNRGTYVQVTTGKL